VACKRLSSFKEKITIIALCLHVGTIWDIAKCYVKISCGFWNLPDLKKDFLGSEKKNFKVFGIVHKLN
jgi:hypothetical protein